MNNLETYTPRHLLPPPPPWMLTECTDYDIEDDHPIIFEGHENKMKMIEEFKNVIRFEKQPHCGNSLFCNKLKEISISDKDFIDKYCKESETITYYPRNEYSKYISINLPLNKSHKKCGFNNIRFRSDSRYIKRESLLKADLYKWCKLNNLPVKKSTHIEEMVKLLYNM